MGDLLEFLGHALIVIGASDSVVSQNFNLSLWSYKIVHIQSSGINFLLLYLSLGLEFNTELNKQPKTRVYSYVTFSRCIQTHLTVYTLMYLILALGKIMVKVRGGIKYESFEHALL